MGSLTLTWAIGSFSVACFLFLTLSSLFFRCVIFVSYIGIFYFRLIFRPSLASRSLSVSGTSGIGIGCSRMFSCVGCDSSSSPSWFVGGSSRTFSCVVMMSVGCASGEGAGLGFTSLAP
eukprot:c2245_g1_i1.p1 GENE.c2245_g1_i1~~c2245_g1_i1.p1  ORF type:complete len:119 (-),score=23.11 c2245_g1_i1:286-642(-)